MPDRDLDTNVKAALAEPPRRVRQLDLPDGRRFWLKRVERLSGLMRLQKGDPDRAFAAERAGLQALAEAGLPVAEVALEGPGWMLMPDAGSVLPQVVADASRTEADKLAAFAQAGRALGLLHLAGLVHGRPAVRDICWDGKEARFIDLERFRYGRRGGLWQAADVVIFTQTCFTRWPQDTTWVNAALEAYAVNAPDGAMAQVRRLVWLLMPVGWLSWALSLIRPQSRELRAVPLALSRLRDA
ncbi:MAG: serine/threonine protein phosphatase [Rhodobacter sp.]|nr:serine/threonine protein phosphatase [Rhodobacter sp.]